MSADERLLGTFIASLGAGLLVYWVRGQLGYKRFPASAFVQPEQVSDTAQAFPPDTDEFILASWEFAANKIEYEPKPSDLHFVNSQARCSGCVFPADVLEHPKANCVGKSALLASLLRNRLPANRVYMAVGQLNTDNIGGHSWVTVDRYGTWYVLESTNPPSGWVSADSLSSIYLPQVFLNDEDFQCYDEKLCIKVSGCDCSRAIDLYLAAQCLGVHDEVCY